MISPLSFFVMRTHVSVGTLHADYEFDIIF